MSLASVIMLGSAAFADPAPEAAPVVAPAPAPARKLSLRVVRVLEETQQALMFDKAKGTHVLVEVGEPIAGYTVTAIDEDAVTLTAEGGQQIVLAGPDPRWRGAAERGTKGGKERPEGKGADAAPEDPYAGTSDLTSAPASPALPVTARPPAATAAATPAATAAATPAPTAAATPAATAAATPAPTAAATPAPTAAATPAPTAPPASTAAASPITVVSPTTAGDTSSHAAWSTTPTAPVDRETAAIADLFAGAGSEAGSDAGKVSGAKASANVETPASASKATAAAPAPSPLADGATVIAKADVTAALGNVGALASAVRGSFGPRGVHLDVVAPDSLFAKAGLQAGDTVVAVNRQPLRSLDDAATLYARAGAMKDATIQIVRAGKPVSLHLAIQ